MSHGSLLAALLLTVGLSAQALAQETNPQPNPPPAAPSATPESKPAKHEERHRDRHEHAAHAPAISTKSFGSWALRCAAGHGDEAHACEISETIETASSKPVAKISVGHKKPTDPLGVVVILPTNVSFPSSVHIRTDKDDKWGLELDWQRCVPGACMAEAVLGEATLAHWNSLNSKGEIVFRDAAGDEVSLPMSFHGFGDAYTAFKKIKD